MPEGKPTYLRDRGVVAWPLYAVNRELERVGYLIHAAKVRDPKRFVACTDKHGRVERYGLFELRRLAEEGE